MDATLFGDEPDSSSLDVRNDAIVWEAKDSRSLHSTVVEQHQVQFEAVFCN